MLYHVAGDGFTLVIDFPVLHPPIIKAAKDASYARHASAALHARLRARVQRPSR